MFDSKLIKDKTLEEIKFFLGDEPKLRADVEYVIGLISERPKAYIMFEFAKALGVSRDRIMPFLITADLIMDAAMNADDVIDDNEKRFGNKTLWKIKGMNTTFMTTDYMYALIFSILKKYRPKVGDADFAAYQQSENLLLDYFHDMGAAQYNTTIGAESLLAATVKDVEKLAAGKAAKLFQYCTSVPAYFSRRLVSELEDFGFQLGIARQYISDILDFMPVPGETYKNGARMEDFFTHQLNLVLVLTGTSSNLTDDEKLWFYNTWKNSVAGSEKVEVTNKVVKLIAKADAIEKAKIELRKIRADLVGSLEDFPDGELKSNMSQWAFRSFPMD